MAVFLGPCLSILVGLLNPGLCVSRAGALVSSICISSKDSTLGFLGGAGLGWKLIFCSSAKLCVGVY